MSEYIVSGEYSAYGLTGSSIQANVKSASALIDGYLLKPEGLVWSPDVVGLPCFMTGAAPLRIWRIAADINPGANVTVALDSALPASVLGEALVLDSPTPSSCETVIVTAIDGLNVTFGNVVRPHSVTSPLSSGLVIFERRNVGYQGPVAFLSRTPVARLLGIGTRWDRSSLREPSLSEHRGVLSGERGYGLGPVPGFGGTARWTLIDPAVTDCDISTGKLDVHIAGARNEVRISYLAGWTQANLPDIVKRVCARMAIAIQNADANIPSNVRLYKAGDTSIQKFAATMMDDDMKFQLQPFQLAKSI